MFTTSIFGKTLDMGQMSLGAYIERKKVIANNIANVDTPHYKRHDIKFEAELNRAIASERQKPIPTNMNHQRHIPFTIIKDFREVNPEINVEYDTNYRNDKNNVDIDSEISHELKNTLQYQAVTTVLSNNFKRFNSILT